MMKIVKVYFKNNVLWGFKSLGDICKTMTVPGCSAFFPFYQNELYIPKPALVSNELLDLSLADHKYHRFMRYLAISDINEYFNGTYSFAEKSNFSFGKYSFEGDKMKFSFRDYCGVYAVIGEENNNFMSIQDMKQLIRNRIGSENEIEIEFDSMGDSVNYTGYQNFYILLNDLETKCYSQIELEELLENASYHIDYDGNNGVRIRSGACFRTKPLWLKGAILLEVKV